MHVTHTMLMHTYVNQLIKESYHSKKMLKLFSPTLLRIIYSLCVSPLQEIRCMSCLGKMA